MTEITDVASAFAYGDALLAGKRVRLRGVREDELATLARWEMDPGPSVTLNDRVAPQSEAAAKEMIAKWSANEQDTLGFAVETRADPAVLVGHVSVFGIRAKNRNAIVGISIGREHIGRGYGTDAMRVIVSYGFRELGLHRIGLSVSEFNQAGIRAYQKAGFTVEGRRRESVLHDGRWYDNVLMSILDYEWAAQQDRGVAGTAAGSGA
jgi:RimJ/RimL family protein N-acetyltransferase